MRLEPPAGRRDKREYKRVLDQRSDSSGSGVDFVRQLAVGSLERGAVLNRVYTEGTTA